MVEYPFWLSIRARVYALILLTFFSVACVFLTADYFLSQSLFDLRSEQTRKRVDAAYSLIEAMNESGKKENYSDQEAKNLAIFYLGLLYDKTQDFWINDLDGNLVLNPSPAPTDIEDVAPLGSNGKVIKEITDSARTMNDGGIVHFQSPEQASAKKLAFVKKFDEWGWIVGSQINVDNIDGHINNFIKRMALATSILALIIFALASWVARSISQPIMSLKQTMQEMADGDREPKIRELGRRDELGAMAQTMQVFLHNARAIALLEAEQKDTDSTKNEFVSVVSHELRTPLTSIRGSLGLVASGAVGELPEKAHRLVSIAHENCQRLIILINDILDIDKASSGDMRFNKSPESVNTLLRTAIEANKGYAEKYFVHYILTPLPEDASIDIDPLRFQQIMSNFLSNAAKYSPGGAKVDVKPRLQNGTVRIAIIDYGQGIPEEFRSRIFKKFSQADSSSTRKKGGTGLGLYISKQLAENMGGQIGYESKMGLGSTFWLEFSLSPHPQPEKIDFASRKD